MAPRQPPCRCSLPAPSEPHDPQATELAVWGSAWVGRISLNPRHTSAPSYTISGRLACCGLLPMAPQEAATPAGPHEVSMYGILAHHASPDSFPSAAARSTVLPGSRAMQVAAKKSARSACPSRRSYLPETARVHEYFAEHFSMIFLGGPAAAGPASFSLTVQQEIEQRMAALKGKMQAIRKGERGAIQAYRNGSDPWWHLSCWSRLLNQQIELSHPGAPGLCALVRLRCGCRCLCRRTQRVWPGLADVHRA